MPKVTFLSHDGHELAASLDMPDGPPIACAIFAHCFTCSKEQFASRRVSRELAQKGFGVLRFDFTGLGGSEGDFENSNFSSNVADLVSAAEFLRDNYAPATLLVGHSLGGAAVLRAAHEIPECRAIATIGAPSDVAHVSHLFSEQIPEIEASGEAEASIGGRSFKIQKQFLDDLRSQDLDEVIGGLKRALLIMHAPQDQIVGIDNASKIFVAAKHPKSFVSLDKADHLLSRREDADFAASVIATWATRYVDPPKSRPAKVAVDHDVVVVSETGRGKYHNAVVAGPHSFVADEPTAVGGDDLGPSPYQLLLASLGACTSMTLRMYAERKGLDLESVSVTLEHDKIHAKDCEECEQTDGKVDIIRRRLSIEGDLTEEQRARMLQIADRCPVHRTLEGQPLIKTELET